MYKSIINVVLKRKKIECIFSTINNLRITESQQPSETRAKINIFKVDNQH